MKDLVNFYYYVLFSEAISKIDAAVKRTSSIVSVLNLEPSMAPGEDEAVYMAPSDMRLGRIVKSQLNDETASVMIHPVQDVALSIARRLVALLNLFNGVFLDYKTLLRSPLLSALNFSLDKKASYMPVPDSIFGDRRVMDKALRLLIGLLASGNTLTASYTGRIEGVTHLWLVKVTIGKELVIMPHVPRLTNILTGGATRLTELDSTDPLSFVKKPAEK